MFVRSLFEFIQLLELGLVWKPYSLKDVLQLRILAGKQQHIVLGCGPLLFRHSILGG